MTEITKVIPVDTGLKLTMDDDGNISVSFRATAEYQAGCNVTHIVDLARDLLPDGLESILQDLFEAHKAKLLNGIELKIGQAKATALALGELNDK